MTKKAKLGKFIKMKITKFHIVASVFIGLISFTFFGCSTNKNQTEITIPDDLLYHAIEYGKSKAGMSDYEFMEPWSVYLGYAKGKGSVVYYTPFLHAARLAKNAAEKHLEPNMDIIRKAVSSKAKTLNFFVSVYGSDPLASRRIVTHLEYNNIRIDPVYSHFPPYADFNRDYYYQISGEVRFPRELIPQDAIVKLCIEIFPPEKNKKENAHDNHLHGESTITIDQQPATKTEFIFNLSKYQ